MIFDAIFGAFASLLASLFGTIPTWTAPDFLTSAAAIWTMVFQSLADLSAWIPLDTVGAMGGAVFATVAASIIIRVVRLVIAYIPTMGGSQE